MNPACAVFLCWLACRTCQPDIFPPPPMPIQATPKAGDVQVPEPPIIIEAAPAADAPFSVVLKESLLKDLPGEIVFNRSQDWGHQAKVPSIQGLRPIEVKRNHGNWEKMRVVCRDLPHRLQASIDRLAFADADRALLTVCLEVPADLEYQKIVWQNGLQLFVGHSRGRAKFRCDVVLETAVTRDGNGKLIPGQRPTFKIVECRTVGYGFVAEYVNGVGGDLASMSGGNLQRVFRRWQQSLERDMTTKVKEAVVTTGAGPELAGAWGKLMTAFAADADLAKSGLTPVGFTSPAARQPAEVPVTSGVEVSLPIIPVAIDLLLNGRRHAEPVRSSFSAGHSHSSESSAGISIHFGSSHSSDHGGHSSSSSHSSHDNQHRK